MPTSILSLTELSWVEVDALDKNLTTVLLPLSPIEEHGPHLPIGTDIFGAQDIAVLAAGNVVKKKPDVQVVVAPVIPLGCAPITSDFPGTISLRGKTLCNLLIDFCSGLAKSGFKYIVIVNHHLDSVHLKAILEAIDAVSGLYDVHIIETAGRILYSGMEVDEIAKGAALGLAMKTEVHADVRETSYIKYRYPHLLKKEISSLMPVLVDIREGLARGFTTFREMGATQGYIGTPALATDELGRIHLEEQGQITADLVLRLMSGQPLPEIRTSILRYLREHVELD